MDLEVWESILDQYEARRIFGKGWTVTFKHANVKFPYCGYAQRDAVRVKQGKTPYWPTKELAVRHAIAHAHLVGTLNWQKTVKWLRLMRISIEMDGLLEYVEFNQNKGWYLSQTANASGNPYWQVITGATYDTARYFCSGPTAKATFRKAVREGLLDEPYYNEQSSIIWLERAGYADLIPCAKRQQKTA